MKKGILVAFAIFTLCSLLNAQNVTIPDGNFRNCLVNNELINTNGDTQIQVSEASSYTGSIPCYGQNISDLTGIEAFTQLTALNCGNNQLSTLDLSQNLALIALDCSVGNPLLTSLDISQNSALTTLFCQANSLNTLNVANGNNANFDIFAANANPNLTCITVDDVEYSSTNWTVIDPQAYFSLNCLTTTALPEESAQQDILIFPNPSVTGTINIQTDVTPKMIRILSVEGRLVNEFIYQKSEETTAFEIRDLNSGVYTIQLVFQDQKVVSKKLVVQ